MIKIISRNELANNCKYTIGFGAWDFPIDELDYLMEEHNNETFVLIKNRLVEVINLRESV